MLKICTKCNKKKNIDEFHKKSNSKDGYRSNCRECSSEYNKSRKEKTREYNKEYQSKNSDSIKENKKKYYLDNIDYFKERNKDIQNSLDKNKKKEYQKKYYNKPQTKEKIKKYRKNKAERDPLYKLTINIRKRIRISLKNNLINNSKYEEILGCSFLEFRYYIENLFIDGMSWENYGEWHLDHRVPISWAKNEEEVYKLSHYTNFQPLWMNDNLSKGNRYSSF
jgi:hypothetical protein